MIPYIILSAFLLAVTSADGHFGECKPVQQTQQGDSATIHEFPYIVALGFGNLNNLSYLCAGNLIAKQYVLTSAHCNLSPKGRPSAVLLGQQDLQQSPSADAKIVPVIETFVHPDYKKPIHYHDIAILKLKEPVDVDNSFIKPACLHTKKEIDSDSLVVTGWGILKFHKSGSKSLKKVGATLSTHENCNNLYKTLSTDHTLPQGIVDDTQICASALTDNDSCQGEGGGPILMKTQNGYEIVGITSFGKTCGNSKFPDVFTRVSHYIPWIESIVFPKN